LTRNLIFFFYTLALALSLPVFLPHLHLIYFAPFLAASFYRNTKIHSLWLAVLCGSIIDLFSAQTRLGFYALTYFLTVELLYSQQRNFFEDRLSTLPVMTFFFALISTIIQVILLNVFDVGIVLSMEWVKNDLILNPLCDALYAILAFTLPASLFFRRQSRPSSMLHLKQRS
jgi:rod shape-determining protein MreD